MGIQVVSNTTASSTAVVRLRASVAVADLTTSSVSYAIPVSTVAYIDLALGVVLDTTGRFKFIPDAIALEDSTAFAVTKPLADTPAAIDAPFISVLKLLADGFAMNDGSEAVDGSVYSFSKGISNVAFTEDAVVNSLAKLNQDQIALLDNAAKVLSRPVADSFGMTDGATVAALKALSDSVELVDTVTTLLLYIRNFDDAANVADVQTAEFSLLKVEQVMVADADTRSTNKPFAETQTASDISTYAFSKAFAESATLADSDTLIFTTSRVESVAATDAGVVSVQDYCDLDYFLEDYVGISQAF